MRGNTAADRQSRQHRIQIVEILLLIRIAKNKVKGTRKLGHKRVGIRKPGIDVHGQASLAGIGQGFFVRAWINFNRNEFSAGFRKRPGYPCGGTPRRMSWSACPSASGTLIP